VTFPANENVRQCRYKADRTAATCEFRRNLPGGNGITFDPPLNVQVAKDAPGPVALTGGIVDGAGNEDAESDAPVDPAAAPVSPDAQDRPLVAPAAFKQQKAAQANAANRSKDLGGFSVFTSRNPADLAVTGGSGHGTVGSTVGVTIKVKNNGPASSPHTTVKVTAPTGTELVAMPVGCMFETPGKVGKCTGPLAAGADASGTFAFKIVASSVGTNGKAEISGTLEDTVPGNNSAAITITVDSGLPVTGAKVTAIAGAGATVLLVGLGLFLVARRRRVVLVTPTEDR
jgi:LPXTG-motif cell wall-anchored protein